MSANEEQPAPGPRERPGDDDPHAGLCDRLARPEKLSRDELGEEIHRVVTTVGRTLLAREPDEPADLLDAETETLLRRNR